MTVLTFNQKFNKCQIEKFIIQYLCILRYCPQIAFQKLCLDNRCQSSRLCMRPLTPSICIYQGWPDFFSCGPFSIILNVLGAANSLISTLIYLGSFKFLRLRFRQIRFGQDRLDLEWLGQDRFYKDRRGSIRQGQVMLWQGRSGFCMVGQLRFYFLTWKKLGFANFSMPFCVLWPIKG